MRFRRSPSNNKIISSLLGFCLSLSTVFSQETWSDNDTMVVDNVTIVPMTRDTLLHNQRVWIAQGRIQRIEAAEGQVAAGVKIINGQGKYLMPGLAEMHYHFRSNDIESDVKLLLANGITTVRNMADDAQGIHLRIRERCRQGGLWSIRYFTTGPYLQTTDLSDTPRINQIVEAHCQSGYDFVKLAGNLPLPLYLHLLQACANKGLPLVGHAQRAMPLELSLRMTAIEHLEEFLHLVKQDAEPRMLAQAAAQVAASGVYVGTTLAGFNFIVQCMSDTAFEALQRSPLVPYLAAKERQAFLTENNDYRKLASQRFGEQSADQLFRQQFAWLRQWVFALHKAGVPLLAGSDTYGMTIVGFSLHQELALLQAAGLSAYNVIRSATVVPARFLGQFSQQGTVTLGKRADLLLVEANPLTDVRHIKQLAGLFINGRFLGKERLAQMLREVQTAYR